MTSSTSIGYALSSQQRAAWRADARCVVACAGAYRRVDRLPGAARLEQRFRTLASAREILRTRFAIPDAGEEPLQLVDDQVRVASIDVRLPPGVAGGEAAADPVAALLRRCRRMAADADLHALIVRLQLVDGAHAVAVLARALATDRATLDHILQQLLTDDPRPAPDAEESEPPLQYADYVGWQESLSHEASAEHARAAWHRVASSWDRPRRVLRPAASRRACAAARTHEACVWAELPPDQWQRLQAECRALGLEPGIAMGLSWIAALDEAGVAVSGPLCVELDAREGAGLPGFLGPMMHAMPIPVTMGDRRPLLAQCRAVQQAVEDLAPWTEYLPRLVPGMPPPASDAAVFAVHPERHDEGTRFSPAGARGPALHWRESAGRLVIELFASGPVAAALPSLARQLEQGLRRFPAEPARDRSRAAASTAEQSGDLLADLDHHVRAQPDRLALVCGEASLSYAVLARQSDAVAGALLARGLGAGEVVAVHLPPSLDLVIALLGIAKSGAAFLPIDSRTPPRRAQYMLQQARATLVLGDAPADPGVGVDCPALQVRDAVREGAARASVGPVPGADQQATAYVLFTSGSTGQPKGVAISWGALTNYLRWCLDQYAIDEGTSIVQTSVGFDLTVTTLLAPFAAGLTVCLVPETNDLPSFARILERQPRVSFLKMTPAQLRLLDQRLLSARVPPPRVLIVGGEALRFEDLGAWPRSGPVTVVNEYGPTEATVGCCCHAVDDLASARGPVPIGRPIPGASLYLLDGWLRSVPAGVRGEIWIAGDGLAKGYVRAPHLTAERFCPDPFATAPGQRMYRTGDFASAAADGVLTYHGRDDDQVKIRGHRVELSEVAAQLKASDGVVDALARQVPGAGGETGLAGYLVLAPDALEARTRAAAMAQVDEWRHVFDDSYRTATGQRFAGWLSSYTGEPIPDAEMQAWVDETVASLLALAPERLLEIGCGNGLLATRLIPHLGAYTGADISLAAIDELRTALAGVDPGGCQVDLRACAAHQWEQLPAGDYNTIVLNSVVQYLPDAGDVRSLLAGCLHRLAPGGQVVIGDVRHLDLLPAFLCSVESQRGGRAGSAGDLRRRVRQRLYVERELNLSPVFFLELPDLLDGVIDVEVRLKQARNDNELTRFRYDVVLHAAGERPGRPAPRPAQADIVEWAAQRLSFDGLRTRLRQDGPDALVVRGLPYGRTSADEERWRRIEHTADETPVAAVLDSVSPRADVDPADVVDVAASCGYDARLIWPGAGGSTFDAILWKADAGVAAPRLPRVTPAGAPTRANRPLAPRIAADFLPGLSARLRGRLPEYMIPNYLLVLDAFPLDQHGKVAVRQLPWPQVARPVAASFTPAATPLEARLCRVWAEVLGVERVGVEDSFFDLGGHSLLAIKLAYRIRTECRREVPLRQLLEAQTVRALARLIGGDAPAAAADAAAMSVEPALTADPGAWHESFPLTDVQQAYVAGRSPEYGLGGVSAHCYLEFEAPGLDVIRLEAALNRLTAIHGMLRSVIHADGTQQVLRRVPGYRFAMHALGGLDTVDRELTLLRIRRRMSHEVLPLGRWPLLNIRVSSQRDGPARLHLSLDNLLFDGLSMEIMTAQLRVLYNAPLTALPAPSIAFRDCVLHERRQRDTAAYQQAQAYWLNRLPDFPAPPDLWGSRVVPAGTTYKRLRATVPPAAWAAVKALAADRKVTASAFLCAAFADVLTMWSKTDRFCIHLTFFNRPPIHPEINDVVGDFTSLTLLDVEASPPRPFAERARAVQQRLAEDLEHCQPGGVWFLREFGRFHASRRPQPAVVFTSTLGLERLVPRPTGTLPLQPGFSASQTPQVGLDHSVYESEGALHVTWDYARGLFEPGAAEEMFAVYVAHLERLARTPTAWDESALPALPAADARLVAAVNSTAWRHPGGLLHDEIWRRIEGQPGAVAVQTADRQLTYAELGAWTAGLMARLRAAGTSAGDLVAIFLDKGWPQVVSTLAISSIGAAYVPLDPAWPNERVRRVLAQCTPRAVIVSGDRGERLGGTGTTPIRIDEVTPAEAPGRPALETGAANPLAYVLFTSGTTGTPKGVAIRHAGAVNTIRDLLDRFRIGPGDRCLQLSNLTFDLSVFDIYGTLSAGGTLVIPRDAQWDPAHWHDLVVSQGVTIWNSVPTLFEMYVLHLSERAGGAPPQLRLAMLSGDWVPVSLPDRARGLMPALDVVSLGGATEASIWSVWYPIRDVDPGWNSVPYGMPLRNQQIYIVDRHLAPRPRSVVGQIAIAGIGLAEGYWRDPDMTAARFPVSPALGQRIYLTGDSGRLHPDGNVEILGREDNQVKIHGYRIELGDIEAALSRVPTIKEAVAKAVPTRQGSGKRLVAYVVPAGGQTLDVVHLRAQLAESLPAYMMPADVYVLPALPLTSNGKVDRHALPVPDQMETAPREPVFDDELMRALAGAWHEVLGAPVVDPEADFFAIGGDSMKTIQLMNWIRRRFGHEVSLRGFLAEPTIVGLASQLRAHAEVIAPAPARARTADTTDAADGDESFPLTDLQFSYWLGRSDASAGTRASSHAYNEFRAHRLPWHAFVAAYAALLRRHDMLRAQIRSDGRQAIAPLTPAYLPKLVDLRGLDDRGRAATLGRLRRGLSHRVYPAVDSPLLTVAAALLPGGESVVHVSMDLLVCDGYSARIITRDLAHFLTPGGGALAPLETSFREFVQAARAFEASDDFRKSRDYWLSRLEGFPPAPSLPLRTRRAARTRARFTRLEWHLPAAAWASLRIVSTARGLTPSGLLCSTFAQTLGMWSAQRRFAINVTLFDRFPHHPQVNDLVGVFTSTLLLDIEHQRVPFETFARQVQSRLWSDIEHRHFNGIRFIRELRKRGGADGGGYPVVFTSTLGAVDDGGRPFPWHGESTYAISQTSGVLLDCQVAESAGALHLNWDVVDDAFEPGSMRRMFQTFTRLLDLLPAKDEAWTISCR